MRRRPWIKLVLLPVVLLSFSCARLDESGRSLEAGMLPVEMLDDEQSVPTEFGQLVAVSESPTGPSTRLWFQDEEGIIRMVAFNNSTARLAPQAWVIGRN